MANLYKKEVVVRPTSTVTLQGAIDFTKKWLNDTFQNKENNKDANGNYINYFFGDIFDARNGNIHRVFSDACSSQYEMAELVFNVLDTGKFATATALETTNAVVVGHTDRLVALENQNNEVEVVVI